MCVANVKNFSYHLYFEEEGGYVYVLWVNLMGMFIIFCNFNGNEMLEFYDLTKKAVLGHLQFFWLLTQHSKEAWEAIFLDFLFIKLPGVCNS